MHARILDGCAEVILIVVRRMRLNVPMRMCSAQAQLPAPCVSDVPHLWFLGNSLSPSCLGVWRSSNNDMSLLQSTMRTKSQPLFDTEEAKWTVETGGAVQIAQSAPICVFASSWEAARVSHGHG